MKAVGYVESLPIADPQSLLDLELPQPVAEGRDLLVKIQAIAVNPVDYKIRQRMSPPAGEHRVLGWDVVGEVIATGEQVTLFKPGDAVYYAGDLNRQGGNAEYQLVDERIVGKKPKSLSNSETAALPLTTITAWELLFEHLGIGLRPAGAAGRSDEVLLVVGAAGGVGSILIQIAKAVTGATVIATASRQSSQAWVKKLGADFVVDHTKPLQPQIGALVEKEGLGSVTHVASLNGTGEYFDVYTDLLAPFGKIAMIDDPAQPLDVMKLKPKSQSLHIEFMFARSMFQSSDIAEQGRLLTKVADLVDLGYIHTTVGKHLGIINAEHLRAAHEELESGTAIGKIVLEGF
ncbi:MAG: zinc-binding alcohol dehydrogenase family protein [bacterium]